MTVDIKCPHCKNGTDYNLNYDLDVCSNCNKDITYLEMYTGRTLSEEVISVNRPYNVEKRLEQSYVNFGVISQYFMEVIMKSFKDKEHKEALKINREMN